jgi:ribosomal protein S18 acetylase RimI-like enzyme
MVEFRSALLDDFSRIADLKRQIHSAHFKHAPDFYRNVDQPLTEEEYRTLLDPNAVHRAYVLLDDNRIVAYAFTQLRELQNHSLIHDQKQLFLDDLCVDTNLRGRGYGARLIQEIQHIAEATGCETIELDVWDWNHQAIEFYKHHGLQFTRLRMKKDVGKRSSPNAQRPK